MTPRLLDVPVPALRCYRLLKTTSDNVHEFRCTLAYRHDGKCSGEWEARLSTVDLFNGGTS